MAYSMNSSYPVLDYNDPSTHDSSIGGGQPEFGEVASGLYFAPVSSQLPMQQEMEQVYYHYPPQLQRPVYLTDGQYYYDPATGYTLAPHPYYDETYPSMPQYITHEHHTASKAMHLAPPVASVTVSPFNTLPLDESGGLVQDILPVLELQEESSNNIVVPVVPKRKPWQERWFTFCCIALVTSALSCGLATLARNNFGSDDMLQITTQYGSPTTANHIYATLLQVFNGISAVAAACFILQALIQNSRMYPTLRALHSQILVSFVLFVVVVTTVSFACAADNTSSEKYTLHKVACLSSDKVSASTEGKALLTSTCNAIRSSMAMAYFASASWTISGVFVILLRRHLYK